MGPASWAAAPADAGRPPVRRRGAPPAAGARPRPASPALYPTAAPDNRVEPRPASRSARVGESSGVGDRDRGRERHPAPDPRAPAWRRLDLQLAAHGAHPVAHVGQTVSAPPTGTEAGAAVGDLEPE